MGLIVSLTQCKNTRDSRAKTDSYDSTVPSKIITGADSLISQKSKILEKEPFSSIISPYLLLKNALANDDGKNAAIAGKAIAIAVEKFDTLFLSSDHKRLFSELSGDIQENAEHIGNNGDKIEHQREHFELLSKDMYDLIKKTGVGKTMYRDFCPMYNSGKGAYWVSEFKDIKNPYLGKKMSTCGVVKSDIN